MGGRVVQQKATPKDISDKRRMRINTGVINQGGNKIKAFASSQKVPGAQLKQQGETMLVPTGGPVVQNLTAEEFNIQKRIRQSKGELSQQEIASEVKRQLEQQRLKKQRQQFLTRKKQASNLTRSLDPKFNLNKITIDANMLYPKKTNVKLIRN